MNTSAYGSSNSTDEKAIPFSTTRLRSRLLFTIVGWALLTIGTSVFADYQRMRASASLPPTFRALMLRGMVQSEMVHVGGLVVIAGAAWAILLRRRKKPIVVLKPCGLEIHTDEFDLDQLAWDEIEAIRVFPAYRFVRDLHVGVVPKDVDVIASRLATASQAKIFRAKVKSIRSGAKDEHFGAPIILPEENLPMTAYELVDEIRSFQLHYAPGARLAGDGAPSDPAVWPPPPATRTVSPQ